MQYINEIFRVLPKEPNDLQQEYLVTLLKQRQ